MIKGFTPSLPSVVISTAHAPVLNWPNATPAFMPLSAYIPTTPPPSPRRFSTSWLSWPQLDKVVAIGEIGLDYYRNHCPHDQQQKAFRQQLALARQCKLPVVIHDRDAHDDVLTILREEKAEEIGGVLHCFSGDIQMAKACLDLGFYLSFTGTITYPKNDALREVIRQVPTERILVETDCPYLAAQPWRGKRNEPSYVVKTAETVAEIKGLTLTDVARITSLNAFELFGVGEVDQASKIAYRIRDSLYLNITNRCSNRCSFCAKFRDFHVKGHQLKLDHEPDFDEVIAAIGDPSGYEEVVFCGYGEPLLRLDLVKEVATWLKQRGIKVRINSDGQANLVSSAQYSCRNSKGLVDELSISLNAPNTADYQRICQSCFGDEGYDGGQGIHSSGTDLHSQSDCVSRHGARALISEACEQLAEELGVEFRTRIYNEVG